MFCEWRLSSSETLVHLLLVLAWSRLFREEDGLPSFSISPRVLDHKLNLYTTFDAILESILFSSNEGDRAESWMYPTDVWLSVYPPNGYLPE